jgi:hypothetical protein
MVYPAANPSKQNQRAIQSLRMAAKLLDKQADDDVLKMAVVDQLWYVSNGHAANSRNANT